MKQLKKILVLFAIVVFILMAIFYKPDIPVSELKAKYSYPNSQYLEVDGMEVHYRINGQGPNLLLLHGTAASLHTWEDWTTELQDSFRVIALDLPAFGFTGPHPKRRYEIETYVEFLSHFTEQLALDSFALAGNSLGGLIAWNYGLAHPQQVKQLILLNSSGFLTKKTDPFPIRLARNPFTSKIVRYFTPKALFKNSLKEVYYDEKNIQKGVLDRYYELGLRTDNRQAFIDRSHATSSFSTDDLPQLAMPTLIIWGRHDRWIPVAHAAFFHQAIPNSELIIYENAGHIPMEEIPFESVKDVRTFLKTTKSSN